MRYVWYIRDEKVKVQRFLSGLPQSYKDRIEFYEPRTLEEVIRKAKYFYEQSKGKPDYHKAWKDKKNEKFDQRKKGFKPSNFRNQQKQPSQYASKPVGMTGENLRIHNRIEGHFNVGNVEDPTCIGIVHLKMGM